MSRPIDDHSLDQLFREARSHSAWTDRPVTEVDLRAIYELTRLGATSANCSPARFVWVTSDEGKAKLQPLVSATNAAKVVKAPVTVIIGYDRISPRNCPACFPRPLPPRTGSPIRRSPRSPPSATARYRAPI